MIDSVVIQMLLILPLILGAFFTISLMKLPDLSIESAYLFGAVLAASLQHFEASPAVFGAGMILLALLGGALVGLTTGIINQFLRIPFLLSAIITNGLFHGITQAVLGSSMISFTRQSNPLELLLLPGLPSEMGMLLFLGFFVILISTLIYFSQLGQTCAIYGNNPLFLQQHGISTRYVVMAGLLIADSFAGLAGYLFAQSNGFVDLTMSYGVVLMAITALIFGKTVIRSRRYAIFIPILGVIFYIVLQQILLYVGFDLKYFNAFQALLVLGAILLFSKSPSCKQTIDHLGV